MRKRPSGDINFDPCGVIIFIDRLPDLNGITPDRWKCYEIIDQELRKIPLEEDIKR